MTILQQKIVQREIFFVRIHSSGFGNALNFDIGTYFICLAELNVVTGNFILLIKLSEYEKVKKNIVVYIFKHSSCY